MSLDLYQDETRQVVSGLRPTTSPDSGAFDGFIRGTGLATMRGLAKAGSAVDMLGAVGPMAQDALMGTGTEAQDRYFKEHDDVFGSAVQHWTPEPNEVGVAAEVVGGLLSTLPLVLASPGLAVATTQVGTAEELVRKGVDAGKAQAVGAAQGAGLGLGIWMPILGQNLWQRVVLGGAGFNVLQGAAMRGASGAILEGTPAAKEFEAFDGKALTLDVLMGMAFGSIAHLSSAQRAAGSAYWEKLTNWAENFNPADKDAVLALRQSEHLNVDSAPGKLADAQAVEAHTRRVRTALDQLAKGESVAVEDLPSPAFEPQEKRMAAAVRQVFEMQGVGDRVLQEEGIAPQTFEVSAHLPPDMQAVEARAWSNLFDAPGRVKASAIEAYGRLPGTEDGKIISTDLARELSPDYAASKDARSMLAPAVHEPSSALVKEVFARKLSEPSANGENLVTFTAGGAGAGKTSGIGEVPITSEIAKVSDVVYDTNFNSYPSAKTKIEQTLAAGKRAAIIYVGRDPVDALVNGSLPRAMRSGRTVILAEHAKTHLGAIEALPKLMADYAGDSRVQFVFIDNSRGRGEAQIAGPEILKAYNLENLDARLLEALNGEKQAGRISDAVYKGTLGDAVAGTHAADLEGVRADAQQKRAEGGNGQPAPLRVFRVGEAGGLARRNAGDLAGIASYLQRVDDIESPASTKASQVTLYETPSPEKFGRYVGFAKEQAQIPFVLEQRVEKGEITRAEAEQMVGAHEPGAEVRKTGGTQYSFPEGTQAKPVGSVPIEKIRSILFEQTGIHGFDNASSEQVEQALKTAFADQLAPRTEAPAAMPGGETEPPPPRGSRRGAEAAGVTADPVMLEAERMVLERPDMPIRVGTGTDGEPITTTVRQFLDEAKAGAAKLREEAKLLGVAAQCLLGIV